MNPAASATAIVYAAAIAIVRRPPSRLVVPIGLGLAAIAGILLSLEVVFQEDGRYGFRLRELVYASRYRTKDTPTSRQAFQLLHKLYPKSDEARDTKYYY